MFGQGLTGPTSDKGLRSQMADLASELDGGLSATNFSTEFIDSIGSAVPANNTVTEAKTTFMTKINPDNIFNIDGVVVGRILDNMTNDGNTDWYSSNIMDVQEGLTYSWGTTFGLRGLQIYRVWDVDNNIVSSYASTAVNSVTIPTNGTKLVVIYYGPFSSEFMVLNISEAVFTSRFTGSDSDFVSYFEPYYELDGVTVTKDSIPVTSKSSNSGKTLITVGDSLTEYKPGYIEANLLKSYPYLLRDNLGFETLYRCCYTGQTMQRYQNIVDHSAVGYLTGGGTQLVANGLPYKAATTDGDFALGDVCIIFLGMNNSTTTNFGTISDVAATGDSATFIAATKYWIEKILTINPKIELYLSSTTIATTSNATYTTLNTNLYNMSVILKQIANLYRIKYIDMFNECGFNLFNETEFYYDGTSINTVHPNDDGHERMYDVFRKAIGY